MLLILQCHCSHELLVSGLCFADGNACLGCRWCTQNCCRCSAVAHAIHMKTKCTCKAYMSATLMCMHMQCTCNTMQLTVLHGRCRKAVHHVQPDEDDRLWFLPHNAYLVGRSGTTCTTMKCACIFLMHMRMLTHIMQLSDVQTRYARAVYQRIPGRRSGTLCAADWHLLQLWLVRISNFKDQDVTQASVCVQVDGVTNSSCLKT